MSSIQLTWQDNSKDELGFSIERSLDGVTFAEIGTVSPNIETYEDATADANTTYYYRVKSYSADGYSDPSNVVEITTAAGVPTTIHLSSFTDTDGTDITAYTPDTGPGFTARSGHLEILSNELSGSAASADGGAPNIHTVDAGVIACTISMDFRFTTALNSPDPAIIACYVDNNNYWAIVVQRDFSRFLVRRVVGGSITAPLIVGGYSMTNGPTYTLEVTVYQSSGSYYLDITLGTINGNTESVPSAITNTSTHHGLDLRGGLFSGNFLGRIDNFEIVG